MATTNLLQWNPTAANQENDGAYLADSQRAGGATDPSLFLAALANKAFFQWSTYLTALFQAFAAKGFTTSDSNLSTLTAQCANFLTTFDVKSQVTLIPYSPTPVLDGSKTNAFFLPLNGNMTLPAITGITDGQLITLLYLQDATGGRVVTYPTQMFEATGPDPTANSFSVQMFIVGPAGGGGQFLRPVGPLMSSDGLFVRNTISGNFVRSTGDAAVAGTLGVGVNLNVGGTVDVTGNADVGGALDVTGNADIHGTANITGDANVNGNGVVNGNENVGSLQIGGAAPIGKVLTGDGTHYVPTATAKPQMTMNDVTGARSFGSTFTNATGAPITVSVVMARSASGGGDYRVDAFVNGDEAASNTSSSTIAGMTIGVTFIVPDGATYGATATNLQGAAAIFLQRWIEWVYA